jgi:hypothetical protein
LGPSRPRRALLVEVLGAVRRPSSMTEVSMALSRARYRQVPAPRGWNSGKRLRAAGHVVTLGDEPPVMVFGTTVYELVEGVPGTRQAALLHRARRPRAPVGGRLLD